MTLLSLSLCNTQQDYPTSREGEEGLIFFKNLNGSFMNHHHPCYTSLHVQVTFYSDTVVFLINVIISCSETSRMWDMFFVIIKDDPAFKKVFFLAYLCQYKCCTILFVYTAYVQVTFNRDVVIIVIIN